MSFQMIIRVAIRAPLMLTFSLLMSFIISGKLALIFLGVIPFSKVKVRNVFPKSFIEFARIKLPFFVKIIKKSHFYEG